MPCTRTGNTAPLVPRSAALPAGDVHVASIEVAMFDVDDLRVGGGRGAGAAAEVVK